MYSIEIHSNSGITPVRTGRTRVTICIFIKINAFGTLTGTTDVLQVVPCKFNEFQYIFYIHQHTKVTTSRPSRHYVQLLIPQVPNSNTATYNIFYSILHRLQYPTIQNGNLPVILNIIKLNPIEPH